MTRPVEILPDVFTVAGTNRFGPGMTIGKTMTVLRQDTELTLLNSARLDDDGERALRSLGTVKHLVRLGCSHGADDPWAIDRFSPTYWAPAAVRAHDGRMPDRILQDGGPLPFAGQCVVFANTKEGEAVVTFEPAQLLITCDCLQAWTTTVGCSIPGRITLRLAGFFAFPVVTGAIWLKKHAKAGIVDDYRRVAALPFERFIAGHGGLVDENARGHVQAAVDRLAKSTA